MAVEVNQYIHAVFDSPLHNTVNQSITLFRFLVKSLVIKVKTYRCAHNVGSPVIGNLGYRATVVKTGPHVVPSEAHAA